MKNMKLVLFVLGALFFGAWCALLFPEAWDAVHILPSATEGIVISKAKVMIGLFVQAFVGLTASSVCIWLESRKQKL